MEKKGIPSSPPAWVESRILGFFNQAQNVSDILDGTIQDDPSDGPGGTMGPTLAARILRTRNTLPRRRFTEFQQLDDIRGVGPGTIKDLIYSFYNPAAKAFRDSMYDNSIIYEANWTLEYDTTHVADEEAFGKLAYNDDAFRGYVVNRMQQLFKEHDVDEKRGETMLESLRNSYIDSYNNSSPTAGYAFALWFYEFDADNWFGWETIQAQTIPYFEYHMDSRESEMHLRFFKGFPLMGIIRPGITPEDLPVVLNFQERAITIWFSALYD